MRIEDTTQLVRDICYLPMALVSVFRIKVFEFCFAAAKLQNKIKVSGWVLTINIVQRNERNDPYLKTNIKPSSRKD